MRYAALLALTLLVAGCQGDPLGKACQQDEQCGSGFDCYRSTCVRVCTRDEECQRGTVCVRYHCQSPDDAGGSTPLGSAPTIVRSRDSDRRDQGAPAVPSVTEAELRAIRHELEALHRDVTRLLEAQGLDAHPATPPPPVPELPE